MKRWFAVPAAMLLLVLVIVGCGSSGSSSSSEETTSESTEATESSETSEAGDAGSGVKSAGANLKVSFISPVASQPGQQQLAAGLEAGAKELGWSSRVLDSNLSADKQVSDIETAINQGDAGIASWTLDPHAAAGAYEQAQSAGIPVIGLNSSGAGLTTSVWYEIQLCEPGGPEAVSAEMIAKMHPHAKTIMVADHVAESTTELSDCFAKEAKKFGLDILAEGTTEVGNASDAQKVFEPLLTKYPEVEAVWGFNDETALGASVALQAAGKTIATVENPEGVVVTGQAGDKGAIEAVEEGRMSWTWDPNPPAAGQACALLINEALLGEKPQKIVIESGLVDSETVGEYVPPEQRHYTLTNLPIKK